MSINRKTLIAVGSVTALASALSQFTPPGPVRAIASLMFLATLGWFCWSIWRAGGRMKWVVVGATLMLTAILFPLVGIMLDPAGQHILSIVYATTVMLVLGVTIFIAAIIQTTMAVISGQRAALAANSSDDLSSDTDHELPPRL